MYLQSVGVAQDYAQARLLFQKAADQGLVEALVNTATFTT